MTVIVPCSSSWRIALYYWAWIVAFSYACSFGNTNDLMVEAFVTPGSIPVRSSSFVQQKVHDYSRRVSSVTWVRRRLDEEWDDLAERRALEGKSSKNNSGVGETAAGAIMGGLLLGPFGALWGASVGANFGAKNSYEQAKKEELRKMGLSDDILEMARDVAMSLETSERGLLSCEDSLQTMQSIARTQDNQCQTLYEQAKELLQNDEETARTKLLERTQIQDKMKQTLQKCVDEKRRVVQMRDNIEKLQERAAEIQSLVSRTVQANTSMPNNDLSLSKEDPLLAKFRDAGIMD
uniref:Uncharacterized protein n=1 Tax=Eucampia antarctica TaxID=49252 RepID=A0A7S2SGT9_9STRA